MAKKPEGQGKENNNNNPQGKSNVIDLASRKCCEETCKKTSTRAGFCDEHFTWYKEGLITNEGRHPRDFDKKYQLFLAKARKTA